MAWPSSLISALPGLRCLVRRSSSTFHFSRYAVLVLLEHRLVKHAHNYLLYTVLAAMECVFVTVWCIVLAMYTRSRVIFATFAFIFSFLKEFLGVANEDVRSLAARLLAVIAVSLNSASLVTFCTEVFNLHKEKVSRVVSLHTGGCDMHGRSWKGVYPVGTSSL